MATIKSAASAAKESMAATKPNIGIEHVVNTDKYDDSELRSMIASLGDRVTEVENREDKDTVYNDWGMRQRMQILGERVQKMSEDWVEQLEQNERVVSSSLNELYERINAIESSAVDDTINGDEEKDVWGAIETLSRTIDIIRKKEDKDTVYDDTKLVKEIGEVSDMVSAFGARLDALEKVDNRLSGIADLTSVFKSGKITEINDAISKNTSKLIYVGPGTYNINGTVVLSNVTNFICMGNLNGPSNVSSIKPLSEYWPGTLYRNDVVRSVVCYCGSGANIYIDKITVRHDYCAFYTYYSKSSNITIRSIAGSYSVKITDYRKEYKSVFGLGGKLSLATKYKPIPDEWYLNSGFMTDHLDSCTVNIGKIENLNYGIHFIETIPDTNPDPVKWGGINFGYIEIQCNTFNVNSIVCKKGVEFNLDDAIEWQNGATVLVKTHALGGNNILGNVFNINSFVAGTGTRTNSVEINHEWYYDQTKDNRRIMFNIISKSNDTAQNYIANNKYNVTYCAGVYDVVVNAKNISSNVWNLYVQPNDVYFNDSTSHAQRNKIKTTYTRGNATGYDEQTTITCGPLLIFDNCYCCEVNNDMRAFFRPNEISVTNSENIRILQVDSGNSGDYYHRVLRTNYKNIKQVMYEGGEVYRKAYNDGFEL